MGSTRFLANFCLILLLPLALNACKKNDSNPVSPNGSPGLSGVISTGPSVDLGSMPIGSPGGTFTVSKPGTPVDGLQIRVPQNAFGGDSRTFQVSYAPIKSHQLGAGISLLSPLITISNGGGYADSVMALRIPVRVPAGQFAMGFFYDDQTGELEGLPLLARDSASITVGSRHFSSSSLAASPGLLRGLGGLLGRTADPAVKSNVVIASIDELSLEGNYDTGFRPGVDDWEFVNNGSYATTGGNCAGQSVTAAWYYLQKKSKGSPALWGRFDNDGNSPKTPGFDADDALGIKFVSMVQLNRGRLPLVDAVGVLLQSIPIISDAETFDLFAMALRVSKKPQLAALLSFPAGHAMVIYGQVGKQLFVADPNYPGALDRRIVMNAVYFDPYFSGPNASDLGHAYSHIYYVGLSPIFEWNTIDDRWREVASKTIGQGTFPDYTLMVLNDSVQFQEFKDGFMKSDGYFSFSVHGNGFVGGFSAYDSTGRWLASNGAFTLPRGTFPVGIQVTDKAGHWVDFKHVHVTSEAEGFLYPLTPANTWAYDEVGFDTTGVMVGTHTRYDAIIGTHRINADDFAVGTEVIDPPLNNPDTGYSINRKDGLYSWWSYDNSQHLIWKYPAKNGDTYTLAQPADTLTFTIDSLGSTYTVPAGRFSNCIVYKSVASDFPGGSVVHVIAIGVGEIQRRTYGLPLANGAQYLAYLSQLKSYHVR